MYIAIANLDHFGHHKDIIFKALCDNVPKINIHFDSFACTKTLSRDKRGRVYKQHCGWVLSQAVK